jgi:hypothetical protein
MPFDVRKKTRDTSLKKRTVPTKSGRLVTLLLALCICLSLSHILPFELVVCNYSIESMKSNAQILFCLMH